MWRVGVGKGMSWWGWGEAEGCVTVSTRSVQDYPPVFANLKFWTSCLIDLQIIHSAFVTIITGKNYDDSLDQIILLQDKFLLQVYYGWIIRGFLLLEFRVKQFWCHLGLPQCGVFVSTILLQTKIIISNMICNVCELFVVRNLSLTN